MDDQDSIVENLKDKISELDDDGLIRLWNKYKVFKNLTGVIVHTDEDVLGPIESVLEAITEVAFERELLLEIEL